ncbi:MAG: hypothetical protein AAB388_03925 [Patescibacteria group bacterium]
MNVFDEYIAYLKDNPEGYWFKRKLYGWGWTPARWQGWAITFVYLVFVFWWVSIFAQNAQAADNTLSVLLPIIGATLLFLIITWKTGEAPKWQWGKPRQNGE